PLWNAIARVRAGMGAGSAPRRAVLVTAAAALAVLTVICAVPMPFHTVAAAVVWPPEQARVRVGTDGFIAQLRARAGAQVKAGDVLVVLEDPVLLADRDKLASRLEQLQSDRYSAATSERARNAEEEIEGVKTELKRTEEKIALLEVRAQTS